MLTKTNLLTALILAAAAAFFFLFLWGIDYEQLQNVSVNFAFLMVSALFAVGFRFLGVGVWINVLRDLGARTLPDLRHLALVYSKAWMARYIPGTVPWIAGRILLAKDLGISRSRLAASTFAELIAQVSAIAAVSLILVAFDPRLQSITPLYVKVLVIGAVIGFLVLLVPSVFNLIARKAYLLLKRREAYDELSINGRVVVRALLTYSIGAFVSGSAYYFLALALWDGIDSGDFLYIIGAANLAGVVGVLTPLVPSGLGTRDATLLVLLALILPKEIALVITVAGRLWTAINDVVFFAITYLAALTISPKA